MVPPERIEFLSAVLLTSRQPDRLVGFYRDVFGLPVHEERHDSEPSHWGCELGDVHSLVTAITDPDSNEVELTQMG